MAKQTAADREIQQAQRRADMASVSNYPPLSAWLEKIGARCVSQVKGARDSLIEFHTVGPAIFIVVLQPKGQGWDIFTSHASNSIPLAIADAEKRLGLPVSS